MPEEVRPAPEDVPALPEAGPALPDALPSDPGTMIASPTDVPPAMDVSTSREESSPAIEGDALRTGPADKGAAASTGHFGRWRGVEVSGCTGRAFSKPTSIGGNGFGLKTESEPKNQKISVCTMSEMRMNHSNRVACIGIVYLPVISTFSSWGKISLFYQVHAPNR
jgi:hypothetical protein